MSKIFATFLIRASPSPVLCCCRFLEALWEVLRLQRGENLARRLIWRQLLCKVKVPAHGAQRVELFVVLRILDQQSLAYADTAEGTNLGLLYELRMLEHGL